MNKSEIERVLREDIHFNASCVDMGWEWEVMEVHSVQGVHRGACGDDYYPEGFLIRTTFQRPDTNTHELGKGFGRWWHVPEDISYSGLVKTAYKACALILEHELMEAFHVKGNRIFDPHHDVQDLYAACVSKRTREKESQR